MSPEGIKALRIALGMTQEQFAHAIGVTCGTVNRWEKGVKPSKLAVEKMKGLQSKKVKA